MAELLYVLMNGTGVGYSVERRVTDRWPDVPAEIKRCENNFIVAADSKAGAGRYESHLLTSLLRVFTLRGNSTRFDRREQDQRPSEGVRGPEPLEDCLRFITKTIYGARGRKLRPVEIHDMACVIANSVIVGGVRRSAMISLSDLDDHEMARAKSGNWWEQHAYRSLPQQLSSIYNQA